MEQIFKSGDRVFWDKKGWGEIKRINEDENAIYPITAIFKGNSFLFTIDGKFHSDDLVPSLSFTEYEMIRFSQVRPRPDLKPGTLIWVYSMDNWLYRRFMNWCNNNKVCTVGQNAKILDNNSCNDARLYSDTWSLECPISN